jgi:hypothetical protein
MADPGELVKNDRWYRKKRDGPVKLNWTDTGNSQEGPDAARLSPLRLLLLFEVPFTDAPSPISRPLIFVFNIGMM